MRPGLAKIIEKVHTSMTLELIKLTLTSQQMLAVLISLTPGRQSEFIDSQTASFQNAALTIVDVKTWWNSTAELLERAYRS